MRALLLNLSWELVAGGFLGRDRVSTQLAAGLLRVVLIPISRRGGARSRCEEIWFRRLGFRTEMAPRTSGSTSTTFLECEGLALVCACGYVGEGIRLRMRV